MNLVGKTIDGYAFVAELGRGGMGTVYRAATAAETPAGPAGSVVAVKVLHPHMAVERGVFERFRREIDIGRRIQHPNVSRVYDAGTAHLDGEELHYMVMELIEGQTLEGLRRELGVVPDQLVYQIADQALQGLQAIHDHGAIHRDVKPQNVVITTTQKVVIMDLGVARLLDHGNTMTEQGEFVGSLQYAAPEQLDLDAEIGPTCDIYSLGLVLYELATGTRPFDAPNLPALLALKARAVVDRPRQVRAEVDPFLDEVISTCLAREPGERFPSAEALREVIRDGTKSAWWQARAVAARHAQAERALARLRLEREAPLVGRVAELGRLETALEEAGAGRGSLLFVKGPSGSGKSRLVYDFLERRTAPDGPRVGAGRATGLGGRAYEPFLEAFSDLLELGDPDASPERERLAERLAGLLPDRPGVVLPLRDLLVGVHGAGEPLGKDAILASFDAVLRRLSDKRPVVVVIEDLHLADGDSLAALGYLARSIEGRRALVVGVFDEDQVAEGSALAQIVQTTGEKGAEALSLGALSRAASDELIRAVVRHPRTVHALGDLLYRRTDGNPLLILEVLSQLREGGALVEDAGGLLLTSAATRFELPGKVSELVHVHLASLDEELRETLDAAAVLGHQFDASTLAAMLEEKRIAVLKRLAVLERRHRLIQGSGKNAFRFQKRQTSEVLYRAIPDDLRVEYHALAADTILSLHEGEDPLPGAVAHEVVRHLLQADRKDEVAPLAVLASRHAVATYHATHASRFLEQVAGALGDADPKALFEVYRLEWDCYGALGRRADQVAALASAEALATENADDGQMAQVLCLDGVTRWRTGDAEGAFEKASAALDLARRAKSREWEANALHTLGAVERHRGAFEACAARWREALEIRREIGDRNGEGRSLASLAAVMPEIGEPDGALEAKESALAIFRELGDRRAECAMLNNVGNSLVTAERTEEATTRFREAIEIAREIGSLTAEGHPTCNLGRAYARLGRTREAEETLARALAIFRAAETLSGILDALSAQADAFTLSGDLSGAENALVEGVALAERSGSRPVQLDMETRLAATRARQGRLDESRVGFGRAMRLAEGLGQERRRSEVRDAMERAGLPAENAAEAAAEDAAEKEPGA